ncbi:hypothetical protein E2P81_ATG07522 [Venturia nashicola]|uniref:Uncharacterized protein n=1 Tax=Venturia nashicola TaxID=86259 RepID=A0A4Z1NZG6_9PEZI|nr:hypothetical protein E6O75_ATG07682 [Venturia nashicola]TLD32032.1 hypothetical protein E2P81_ATG07522 [Venturia nashicola]
MSSAESRADFSDILTLYLSGQTTLDRTIANLVADVETLYTQPLPIKDGAVSAEDLLWSLWKSILEASKKVDFFKQKNEKSALVTLMVGLKRRSTPAVPEDIYERVKDQIPWSLGELWGGLAIWGWQVREMWDVFDLVGVVDGADGLFGRVRTTLWEWVGFNAFLAGLSGDGVVDHCFLGQSLIGLTLECDGLPRNVSAAVGGSSVWLILVGEKWGQEGWEVDGLMKFKVDRARMRRWEERLVQIMGEGLNLEDGVEELATQAIEMLQLVLR